jgi:hypothetical protein
MVKISVEIPLTWGTYIGEVLEALRTQTFQDYEVIISHSLARGSQVLDVVKKYDVKLVESGPHILEKRYLAHTLSSGEFSLLLDETRVPLPLLLEKLATCSCDMAIIGEEEVKGSFWQNAASLDKRVNIICGPLDFSRGYLLPRYFRGSLLTTAFNNILKKLGEQRFKEVLMEDHQLISYEAHILSDDIQIIREALIMHHGDRTLSEIFSKYYRYGYYHRVLRGTPYAHLISLTKRTRKICEDAKLTKLDTLKLYMILLARGIPFALGYYIHV